MDNSIKIKIENTEILRKVLGIMDKNLLLIEEEFDVDISIREDYINLSGKDKEIVEILIKKMIETSKEEKKLDDQKVNYYINKIKSGEGYQLNQMNDFVIGLNAYGKTIRPKTLGQRKYIEAIEKNVLTFGVGPAGTGKTYLAVAMAVREFRNKNVNKIIITRPAVEAGENLGFLPGDLEMKIDPYLRPLYDALYNILGVKAFLKYKEKGLIEVAPLAYMRGRTLDNAFIILDEAQNSTIEQMKMFLTRFGFGSKVVVNGDITQVDLKKNQMSGLVHAIKILDDVKGINISRFKSNDIVRHKLVKSIISRYQKASEEGDK